MGKELLELLNHILKDTEDLQANYVIALKFVKTKLEMYLENSIKQYNGDIKRGTDIFVCKNFLNLMTDYSRYFIMDSNINKKQLNRVIDWLWFEIKKSERKVTEK